MFRKFFSPVAATKDNKTSADEFAHPPERPAALWGLDDGRLSGVYNTIRNLIQHPDALFTEELRGGGGGSVDKATKAHYLDVSAASC